MKLSPWLVSVLTVISLLGCSTTTTELQSELKQGTANGIDDSALNTDQQRASIDEKGIGGSGRTQDLELLALEDEKGIGGSGLRQAWLAQLQPGKKIGVLGSISAFGSIWVNGLRIHYDNSTPISIDGQDTQADQLALGQRVLLTAQRVKGQLVADKIELLNTVIGPVSAINRQTNRLTIVGQQVQLSARTINALPSATLPQIGDWLNVAGTRNANAIIEASYIAPAQDYHQLLGKVLLRGQLQRSAHGYNIAGQALALNEAAILRGGFVVVRGRLSDDSTSGSVISIDNIESIVPLTNHDNVDLLSIERSADNQQKQGPYGPAIQPLRPLVNGLQVIDIQLGTKPRVRAQGTAPRPTKKAPPIPSPLKHSQLKATPGLVPSRPAAPSPSRHKGREERALQPTRQSNPSSDSPIDSNLESSRADGVAGGGADGRRHR